MADYSINAVTRRVVYTGSAGVGPYAFSFEVLAATDIAVYKNSTKLTLTTNYTVTINANGTGSVTLTSAATGSDTITIIGSRAIERTTDFVTAGDLLAASLNEQLDSQIVMIQQLAEENKRTLKAPQYDPASVDDGGTLDMVLPVASSRASKTLAFDASGNPIAGPTVSDVSNAQTYASNAAASATAAAASATTASSAAATTSANVTAAASSATSAAASASTASSAASSASSSATSAATSASTATTKANESSASAALANDWATKTTGTVAGGEYSAKYHAQAAATSSSSASTSASNAATSASSASTQATNAANSATSAATSATNASNSATSASASAAAASAAVASTLYRQVLDKTANYTIVAADQGTLFRADTSGGAITFTLPLISSTSDGFKVSIVKWTGDANAVNIVRSGTNTINGATSSQIGSQYAQIILVADFESNTWFASSSGLGATNMNVDVFSGNGSTTVFTLSGDPGNKNNTDIFIGGVHQDHVTYSISGTTLTFTTAPPSGSSNIEVVYGTPLAVGTPSDGTVTAAKIVAGAVDLTTKVSGVLPAANGGTGLSTPGTAGNVLTSDGTNWTSQTLTTIPTGTVLAFGSPTPPTGYLACDGSIYNKSSYTALSTLLGSQPSFIATRNITLTNTTLTYSNNVLFAGQQYSTNNGVTWASIGTGAGYGGYIWTGTYYVGSGQTTGAAGTNYRSTLGGAGTSSTGIAFNPAALVYTGSRVLAVNGTGGAVSYSTNGGAAFTAGTALTTCTSVTSGAFGNGVLVAVGKTTGSVGGIWTTADGTANTLQTKPSGFGASDIRVVTYVNSLFVAVDSAGAIASSPDGVTWTLKTAANTLSFADVGPYFWATPNITDYRVSYCGGLYFLSSWYSTDLVTWKLIPPQTGLANWGPTTGYPNGNSISDGTRVYFTGSNYQNGCGITTSQGCTITPFNYTTATQFIVPKMTDVQSPSVYYHIKT